MIRLHFLEEHTLIISVLELTIHKLAFRIFEIGHRFYLESLAILLARRYDEYLARVGTLARRVWRFSPVEILEHFDRVTIRVGLLGQRVWFAMDESL